MTRPLLLLALVLLLTTPLALGATPPLAPTDPWLDASGDTLTGTLVVAPSGMLLFDGMALRSSSGVLTFGPSEVCTRANAACVGPAGPMGPAGPQGPRGEVGPAGAAGAAGPAGATGPAGARGLACWDVDGDGAPSGGEDVTHDGILDTRDCRGADGAPGPEGPVGPAGADGATGPVGPAGPAGAEGAPGPAGPQGPPGVVADFACEPQAALSKLAGGVPICASDAATLDGLDSTRFLRSDQHGAIAGKLTAEGGFFGPDGSYLSPTYSFSNDKDTGMWRDAMRGQLSLVVDGQTALAVDNARNVQALGGRVVIGERNLALSWDESDMRFEIDAPFAVEGPVQGGGTYGTPPVRFNRMGNAISVYGLDDAEDLLVSDELEVRGSSTFVSPTTMYAMLDALANVNVGHDANVARNLNVGNDAVINGGLTVAEKALFLDGITVPPETRTLSLTPYAFQATRNNINYNFFEGRLINQETAAYQFFARLDFPDFARLTALRVWGLDDSSNENLDLDIMRTPHGGSTQESIAKAISSGRPGAVALTGAVGSIGSVVDNARYHYFAVVNLPARSVSEPVQMGSLVIEYVS